MDQESFATYLTDRYDYQIQYYERKAQSNQNTYRWMQWVLIVLAGLTPVLIELNPPPLGPGWFQWATLTSAVVAILTAGLKTFKYQENWMNFRTTCETLRKEKYLYEAGVEDYAEADNREALFVSRVESLISNENTKWITTHRAESKTHRQDTAGRTQEP